MDSVYELTKPWLRTHLGSICKLLGGSWTLFSLSSFSYVTSKRCADLNGGPEFHLLLSCELAPEELEDEEQLALTFRWLSVTSVTPRQLNLL